MRIDERPLVAAPGLLGARAASFVRSIGGFDLVGVDAIFFFEEACDFAV